jgi:hypothetical protein
MDVFALGGYTHVLWLTATATHAGRYLREENRVLRAQLGGRPASLHDDERRSLAVKARLLGRKMLAEMAAIVTPQTLVGY